MKIDPRSDHVVLHYTGNDAGEPAIGGVPARDLTESDLSRLVAVDHGTLSGAALSAATDKLVDGLTDGPYRKTPADKPQPKRPEPQTPTPAEPSVVSTEGEPS